MSSDAIEPIEEDPNTAEAVDDEAPVASLAPERRGTPDDVTPVFREPGQEPTYRTGAEQQWDPEDYAVAQGWDPTPENIERARKQLAEWGPAAIEKTVP
ncbi:MAG: hypothetical protein HOU81_24115 [Hamadaea sp.]|uniref:hypothetical protein n=1 Tax=Hamadaea sp. TaxID=2024425 RepID=UPI0017C314D2|nr:hypothetical protein [Hamadaea sp.]NUR73911.1 hypothetical protein [Hamadaea sp.]NUT19614.1 hypothetical protein [Hamadaea sp.]